MKIRNECKGLIHNFFTFYISATIEGKESIQQLPERLAGNLGSLPPKYLKVEGHKDCMGTKDMGSWQAICLHLIQPEKCKDDAWTQLKGLTGTDEVLQCEEEGMMFFARIQIVSAKKVNVQA